MSLLRKDVSVVCLGCYEKGKAGECELVRPPPGRGAMDGPWIPVADGKRPPLVETCDFCGGQSILGGYVLKA